MNKTEKPKGIPTPIPDDSTAVGEPGEVIDYQIPGQLGCDEILGMLRSMLTILMIESGRINALPEDALYKTIEQWPSRALSMAITKLEEGILWYDVHKSKIEQLQLGTVVNEDSTLPVAGDPAPVDDQSCEDEPGAVDKEA